MANSLSQHLGELKLSGTNCDFVNAGVPALKVGDVYYHTGSSNELRYGSSAPTTAGSGTAVAAGADSVGLSSLDTDVLQVATVTLDTTDIQDLESTPITMVAAQGANTIIQPIHLVGQYTYDTTAFTIGGSDVFALGYSGGATVMSIAGTGWVDQTSSSNRAINATATAYTPAVNTLLRFTNTGTGFSDGGSSSVKFTLYYRVITIS